MTSARLVRFTVFAATSLVPALASAATLQVGPTRTYTTVADAAAAAKDGDRIEIDAGTYTGAAAWARFTANDLTIVGVGTGMAHMDGAGSVWGGMSTSNDGDKGMWVVNGNGNTIQNVELSGAGGTDSSSCNGAAIRAQGDGLTVMGVYIHDNQEGILGGGSATSSVLIDSSHFERNGVQASDATCGARAGYEHNIYIGVIAKLVVQYSWFGGAWVGHNIKSRANETRILYNRITDEGTTTTSYEVDLPNGGRALVIGNLIEQSALSQNPTIVSFGEEATSPTMAMYFVNNTVVNDLGSGTMVSLTGATAGEITDNLFVGGDVLSVGTLTQSGNVTAITASAAGLVDATTFNYQLAPTSVAINVGVDPGSAGTDSLTPTMEYVHPTSHMPRPSDGMLDVGAYEYAGPPPNYVGGETGGETDEAGVTTSDATTNTDATPTAENGNGSTSGCGCRVGATDARRDAWVLATAALALVALGRRRRARR